MKFFAPICKSTAMGLMSLEYTFSPFLAITNGIVPPPLTPSQPLELARLLSGEEISEQAIANAKKMLNI